MKRFGFYLVSLIALVIVGCEPIAPVYLLPATTEIQAIQPESVTPTVEVTQEIGLQAQNEASISITPKPTPTPKQITVPFEDLYGCQMQLTFTSGPLKGQSTEFEILDESYFQDKGDKFAVGKGTAIFYEKSPYLILHSSYVNGNILRPMEAEFIRKYLEHWGNKGNETIQDQIDALVGSQAEWNCNGVPLFRTELDDTVRLSHEASEQLWLEPENIDEILIEKAGEPSEWIGELDPSTDSSIYLGFCGWGPASLESGRYTYYRYVLNFTILDHSNVHDFN